MDLNLSNRISRKNKMSVMTIHGPYGKMVFIDPNDAIEFQIVNMNKRGKLGFGVQIGDKVLDCRTRGEASTFMKTLRQDLLNYRRSIQPDYN